MLSYLLRKTKLIDVFKDIGLYQEEPKIPPEVNFLPFFQEL